MTVREAALEVLRERRLTTMFANPGSTEVPFLAGLPDDLTFVLALHEGSVVGMATGWAIGKDEPALAVLHTTAGLGNAVGALATARVNRAPVVVLVGQQDRRHLAHEPFLTGRLRSLAGSYPVWVDEPARPQDLPGAISRAWHEATTGRGPALVIAPMDDWTAPAANATEQLAAAGRVVRATRADPSAADELVALLDGATSPAIVVGAGADDPAAWTTLVALAEKIGAAVWQESFGARAGFPQDHPQFAGHLPADRARLRAVLEPYDVVLVVGAPAFRQYPFAPGPLYAAGKRVAVVTDDPAEAHRSAAELAVLAPVGAVCADLLEKVRERTGPPVFAPVKPVETPTPTGPLRSADVFIALAARLPHDAVVIEETPSSRPFLHAHVPARAPLGFLSAAMGGLGFALPGAIGLKLARRDRPVLTVAGEGSALYSIQALWSAAHYEAGVLFVVLSNGGYAVMDRLAERAGGAPPWPSFEIDIAALAVAFGCPARRLTSHDELEQALDEILPTLADRDEPLLLELMVTPDETFEP
jgi:benzoylformate decarboxylase